MRHLHHDFLRTRPGLSPLAWLLVLAGLSGLTAALHDHNARSARIEALDEQIGQLAQALRRSASTAPGAQSAPAKPATSEATAAAARLSVRWGALLDAIEQAQDGNALLLSVEPDAVRGRVRLTGEARNVDAIAAYSMRLAEQSALSEVRLSSEQHREAADGNATEFSLDARWQQHADRRAGAQPATEPGHAL